MLKTLSDGNIVFNYSSFNQTTPLEVIANLDEFFNNKSSLKAILADEKFLKTIDVVDWQLQQGFASIRGYSRLQTYSTTKFLLEQEWVPNQNALQAGFRCFNYPFLVPYIESLKKSPEGKKILVEFFQNLCVDLSLQIPSGLLIPLAQAVAKWVEDIPSFVEWFKNDPKGKLSIIGEKLVPILHQKKVITSNLQEEIFKRLDCLEVIATSQLFSIEKFQNWLFQEDKDNFDQLQLFIYTALNIYQDHEFLIKWLKKNFSSSFQIKPGIAMACLAHLDQNAINV